MPATSRSVQTERDGAGGVGGCGAAGAQPADRAARMAQLLAQLLSLAPTTLLPPVPSLAPPGCSPPTPARGRGIRSGWFKQIRESGPSSAWGHPRGPAKTSSEFSHSGHSSHGSRAHSSYLPLSLPGLRATRRSEGARPEPASPCPPAPITGASPRRSGTSLQLPSLHPPLRAQTSRRRGWESPGRCSPRDGGLSPGGDPGKQRLEPEEGPFP